MSTAQSAAEPADQDGGDEALPAFLTDDGDEDEPTEDEDDDES